MTISTVKELMDWLATNYPKYDVIFGTTNALKAPSVIVSLDNVETVWADDGVHDVVSATYQLMFYVTAVADFKPLPVARQFGNVQEVRFNDIVDGDVFITRATITGGGALW